MKQPNLILSLLLPALFVFSVAAQGQTPKTNGDLLIAQYAQVMKQGIDSEESLKQKILNRQSPGCRDFYSSSECLKYSVQKTSYESIRHMLAYIGVLTAVTRSDQEKSRLTKTQAHLMIADIALLIFENLKLKQTWVGRYKPSKVGEHEALDEIKREEIKFIYEARDKTERMVSEQLVAWAQRNLDAPPGAEKDKQMKKMNDIVARLQTLKKRDFSY